MKTILLSIYFTTLSIMLSNPVPSTASIYHDKYHGRRAANGEIFSKNKLTAASNNYKLNTMVKVTNEKTGKFVIVKITDRMAPNYSHRIDLSKLAAAEIGLTTQMGVTKVTIEEI